MASRVLYRFTCHGTETDLYLPTRVGSTALHGLDRGQLQHRADIPPAARSATLRNEQPGTAHP